MKIKHNDCFGILVVKVNFQNLWLPLKIRLVLNCFQKISLKNYFQKLKNIYSKYSRSLCFF